VVKALGRGGEGETWGAELGVLQRFECSLTLAYEPVVIDFARYGSSVRGCVASPPAYRPYHQTNVSASNREVQRTHHRRWRCWLGRTSQPPPPGRPRGVDVDRDLQRKEGGRG
jgi:hypothetical protein